jgi:hypothetical protein
MSKRPIPDTPALTYVFNIIGGLCVVAGVAFGVIGFVAASERTMVSLMAILPGAIGMIVLGIIYIGMAQVIQLIARIAQECARTADAAEQTAASGAGPQSVRALYLYQYGADVRGPVPLADLRTLRAMPSEARMVTGETLVCQQGTVEWKRLAEVMK